MCHIKQGVSIGITRFYGKLKIGIRGQGIAFSEFTTVYHWSLVIGGFPIRDIGLSKPYELGTCLIGIISIMQIGTIMNGIDRRQGKISTIRVIDITHDRVAPIRFSKRRSCRTAYGKGMGRTQ